MLPPWQASSPKSVGRVCERLPLQSWSDSLHSESQGKDGKKVQAKAVPMDFSQLDNAAQWNKLQSELAGLDVGVLGASYSTYSST